MTLFFLGIVFLFFFFLARGCLFDDCPPSVAMGGPTLFLASHPLLFSFFATKAAAVLTFLRNQVVHWIRRCTQTKAYV